MMYLPIQAAESELATDSRKIIQRCVILKLLLSVPHAVPGSEGVHTENHSAKYYKPKSWYQLGKLLEKMTQTFI